MIKPIQLPKLPYTTYGMKKGCSIKTMHKTENL